MKPIIDIHEHIFRGKDIPLEGFLFSRNKYRIINFFGHILFYHSIAYCIRRNEREREKAQLGNLVGKKPANSLYRILGTRVANFICRMGNILANFFAWLGIKIANLALRGDYDTWAKILSIDELERVVSLLMSTFKEDKTDLYVPLVIDYEYWFKNTKDILVAKQVEIISGIITKPEYGGKVHPFIPFDPARELAYRFKLPKPDDLKKRERPPENCSSLQLVKDAIERKGFIGVKIYNNIGYRPSRNAAVEDLRNKKIFHEHQMDLYTQLRGEDFDQVLTELYKYCVKEQVPITTHCFSEGTEAYPKASYDFGDPLFWEDVLEKYPTLHVNFAHFGWTSKERFLGKKKGTAKTWVKKICELAEKYKYVFFDVSHHEIFQAKIVKQLKSDYEAILIEHKDLLQKRLLFGIDWHVFSRVKGFRNFKNRYTEFLLCNNIFNEEEVDDFLGGNALRFLGLLPIGTDPEEGWSKNRIRLKTFYQKNNIALPEWFTATDYDTSSKHAPGTKSIKRPITSTPLNPKQPDTIVSAERIDASRAGTSGRASKAAKPRTPQ